MTIDVKLPTPTAVDDSAAVAWVPPERAGRRRMLWAIGGSMQCSILGTCLSEDDLLGAMRKCHPAMQPGASGYDIHAHCVRMATSDTALARTLHKLLDRRYEGALRLIARAETEAQLKALWARLRD
jgi:hypothetical protein